MTMTESQIPPSQLEKLGDLNPQTSIRDLCEGDRLLRGQLLVGLLSNGPLPEELLEAVDTVEDLSAWRPRGTDSVEQSTCPDWPRRTRRMELRPIVPQLDYGPIYHAANSPASSYRWPGRGQTIAPDAVGDAISMGSHCQLIVTRIGEPTPVGLLTMSHYSPIDGHAEISVLGLRDQHPGQGHLLEVFEGVAMFVSYIIGTFGLRKVVASIPGWNWKQFESGDGVYFEVEGRLRDHDLYDGRTWDRHLIAIHRDRWHAIEPSLVSAFANIISGENSDDALTDGHPRGSY